MPFLGSYLLVSLNPTRKGRTYIGFTVNPERRLRQHNGELTAGAKKTSRMRPCEMVLIVHGFPTKVQALQFEWCWQKPRMSSKIRDVAQRLNISDQSSSCLNKVRLVFEMLHVAPFRHYQLRVHFFSAARHAELRGKCRDLPSHMSCTVGPLEVLQQEVGSWSASSAADDDEDDDDDGGDGGSDGGSEDSDWAGSGDPQGSGGGSRGACGICAQALARSRVGCGACGARWHASCAAEAMLRGRPARQLLPEASECPACQQPLEWGAAIAAGGGQHQRRGGVGGAGRATE